METHSDPQPSWSPPANRTRAFLRSIRPHQWVKNLFVLAPMVFAGELTHPWRVAGVCAVFLAFSFASSAVYLMNDIRDVEEDRIHPIKRRRPIASGALPIPHAKAGAIALLLLVPIAIGIWFAFSLLAFPRAGSGSVGAFVAMPLFIAACIGSYLLINIGYTFWTKRVPYLDVISIASGFVLRVLGGSFAAWVAPSRYLLIVTFVLAAFLGFGKRMHELVQSDGSAATRKVLGRYNRRVLRDLLIATAVATVAVYLSYTLEPATTVGLGTRWMWPTTIFTAYGVFRFLQLVLRRDEADSPTEQMLRDRPFLANLALWGVTIVLLIYLS